MLLRCPTLLPQEVWTQGGCGGGGGRPGSICDLISTWTSPHGSPPDCSDDESSPPGSLLGGGSTGPMHPECSLGWLGQARQVDAPPSSCPYYKQTNIGWRARRMAGSPDRNRTRGADRSRVLGSRAPRPATRRAHDFSFRISSSQHS